MAELRKLAHNKETTPSKAGQELKEKIKQRFGKVKIAKPANDSEADIPLTNQRAGLVDLLYEGELISFHMHIFGYFYYEKNLCIVNN